MSSQLLTAKEAAKLLGVSGPTFQKIRKQYRFTSIPIGSRVKFSKAEIEKLVGGPNRSVSTTIINPTLSFTVLDSNPITSLETEPGVFDLRKAKLFDSYGAVSLLCHLIWRCRNGETTELLIEDNRTTQHLRSIGFFDELEQECDGKIGWDKTLFSSPLQDLDEEALVPLQGIKLKGNDRMIASKLIDLLRKLGFSPSVGRKIAHIMGELCDNALTHSHQAISQRKCFIVARRLLYGEKNCVVLGVADIGLGIHTTLKTNPKHKNLSDQSAFIEAFKPFVSSWDDEAKRGKGLTDVVSVAWGNRSLLRVDSGQLGLYMNFAKEPLITQKKPLTEVPGTRFAIVFIDNEFHDRTRDEVNELIERKIKEE